MTIGQNIQFTFSLGRAVALRQMGFRRGSISGLARYVYLKFSVFGRNLKVDRHIPHGHCSLITHLWVCEKKLLPT